MSQLRTGREKTPKKGKQVLEGSRKNDDQLAKLGIPKIPLVKKQSKSKVVAAVKPAAAALSFNSECRFDVKVGTQQAQRWC